MAEAGTGDKVRQQDECLRIHKWRILHPTLSRNGKISLYLGRRDFVDHVETVDVIDGVLKVDPSELDGRKVWVQLACAFRYGREDLDVIGLSFRKDIWVQQMQIYPPVGNKGTNTPMQESLLKKAGEQGHAFAFTGYIANEADNPDEKVEKKDTCRLIIRKIQYAPDKTGPGPKADICRQFMMSDKPVHLEAALDKEIYYHGDPIVVKVKINNETNKVVKKIKITIDQTTDVVLYSADKYTKAVLNEEFGDSVNGNSTFEKEYQVTPLLANNKEKRGLALDGRLKDEDTNLASTTVILGDLTARTDVKLD
ncbi:hypothetical protein JZ751_025515 [Albula glossodonta]|uniref:Arrestin-C n=1 Tax=Albula glossodonta TaxID=121402 RepID=A0A8T2NQP5_9TELE|nr:hypothetical protein JZ751_025515 [Albula glossodonta]